MKTKFIGINEDIESYGDEKWYEFDGEELSEFIESLTTEQEEILLKRMNDNEENIYVEEAYPTDNMSTYYRIVAGWKNDTDMSNEDYANDCIDFILITINSCILNTMQTFYNKNKDKFDELDEYGNAQYETMSVICEIWKDGKSLCFDYGWEMGGGASPHIIEEYDNDLEIDEVEFNDLFDIISVMDEDGYMEYNGYQLATNEITYYNNNENEQKRIKYEEII